MAAGLLAALTVGLGIDTAAFSEGLKSAQSKLSGFGNHMKTGLVASAAAAGAAIGGLAYATKGAIDAFDAIEEASQKIGIPIEELSRLKYAAEMSGVSFDTLQTGARKLSSLMVDSANGVKGATEAMTRFGLSATNADGSMKSASQVMGEIADKFAAMPDGAEKTAMAVDLFGKAGTDMILMLNGGSQAINGLMLEAEKFGQVVTQEAGQSAAMFNENVDRLRGTLGALTGAIATAVLPALLNLSEIAVGAISAFDLKLLKVDDYKFYISPEAEGRNKNRIIIPYYYQSQLVGNTSRFLDDRKPKYISDQQRGFVFNIDGQRKDWQVCIVVEGQFDAISIGGCAVMGNTILDEQASILNKLYRLKLIINFLINFPFLSEAKFDEPLI
jgi:hypothetical protein